ncbi:hypothetical protein [Paenibacillus cremeus]|uniref:hypothetical protein n=1 Tax=Paenibacillus cremeus TaxID=2163881 RepID=UPI0021BD2DB6|nr:hypothetical protein [Paenibacillus cremeus]
MPDWSYQTLFRPLLFKLKPALARALTLQAMGRLSRLPGGLFVIRTLSHMESFPILESRLGDVRLPSPVGLSGTLDPQGTANKAMSPFGFGFIEVGPVTVRAIQASPAGIRREDAAEAIVYPEPYAANAGLDAAVQRLSRKQGHSLPLFIRLRPMPGSTPEDAYAQLRQLASALAPYAAAWYIDLLDEAWPIEEVQDLLQRVRQALGPAKPVLLCVPLSLAAERLRPLLSQGAAAWDGFVNSEAESTPAGAVVGREGKARGLAQTRLIREQCGGAPAVVAACGVHEPQDALELLQAGATYVQLHSGLVYAGPGLPKRINEAIIAERLQLRGELPEAPSSFWSGWGWMCLLGIGMLLGGLLAWIIAATSVVLPYDLQFLGLSRSGIGEANTRLLGFMSHDRVTLAGTMISIGVLYYQLARYGLRYGQHWAKTALMVSGLVGFSSFFLYFGYGYFDPLHALVAMLLLPLFVLSMRGRADRPPKERPSLPCLAACPMGAAAARRARLCADGGRGRHLLGGGDARVRAAGSGLSVHYTRAAERSE